jgi:hypothetical protein
VILAQFDVQGEFSVVPGVIRYTSIMTFARGSFIVTANSVSFVTPPLGLPLSTDANVGKFSIFGSLKQAEARENARLAHQRKVKRSLYQQILEAEDVEKKVEQLIKYRDKALRLLRQDITEILPKGRKLTIMAARRKHKFKLDKEMLPLLEEALDHFEY